MDYYSSDGGGSDYSDHYGGPYGSDEDVEEVDDQEPEPLSDESWGVSETDFEDIDDEVTFGKLVERLKHKVEKKDSDSGVEKVEGGSGYTDEMWLTLPGEVMVSIVARLPFSSFCKFRCVCKKWNALVVYPDATLMRAGNSHEVPLCVMYTGLNQFASYNPSSHSWHYLPSSFGSSFGVLGFNCEETRVVAGSSGLLVLESLHMGLWVVNPINKSERRLPPLPRSEEEERLLGVALERGFMRSVHVQLDDGQSSFKIYKVCGDINSKRYTGVEDEDFWGLDIHIYDSVSDFWDTCHTWYDQESCQMLSAAEFDGDICCLVLRDRDKFHNPCDTYVLRYNPKYNSDGQINLERVRCCTGILPRLPRRLRGGQFAVKDGNLLLAGVVHNPREGERIHSAHIWELSDYRSEWCEIEHMPVEFMGHLSFHFEPHVSFDGDYMWVTDFGRGDTEVDLSRTANGIMCHVPSHTWWKLPKYMDSPMLALTPRHSEEQELYAEVCGYYSRKDHHGTCPPFFFNPRMDLVV